ETLRAQLRKADPDEQELFQLPLGSELVRLPLDIKLDDGRVHGTVPLIVEPRWTSPEHQVLFAAHPPQRDKLSTAEDRIELEAVALAFFRHIWKDYATDAVEARLTNGKDRLVQLSFSAEPKTLLDTRRSRKRRAPPAAFAPRPENVLAQIGTDETQKLASGQLRLGV